ncbi:MAG: hypothetical protein JWR08_1526, partial [Enterovirga sp.]|nr:hypothetical protein [Enterovirga sp.]
MDIPMWSGPVYPARGPETKKEAGR